MAMTNPLKGYDPITTNSKVKFLQGTQANLNKYFAGSNDANSGKAIEGAFYLTTDTHKLYVGRKSKTQVNNEYPIYPEQVSRGVTIVETVEELQNVTTVPAGAIEEGELFYVTQTNILAALRKNSQGNLEWAQINAPTGIDSITNDVAKVGTTVSYAGEIRSGNSTSHNDILLNFIEGNNISLTATPSSGGSTPAITIAATDTTYAAKTAATASGQTNGGSFGLAKDGATTLNSTINITGQDTVAVTTTGPTGTGANTITVKGPTLDSIEFTALSQGFEADLNYTTGSGSTGTVTTTAANKLNPTIKYGILNSDYEVTSNNTTTVTTLTTLEEEHFENGAATLNVYTKEQTDYKIKTYIAEELSTADAMTYCGTIDSSNYSTIYNGNRKNGDTYKVTSALSGIGSGGTDSADIGDLIIFKGTEGSNGYITAATKTIDIIPSGDEQLLTPDYDAFSTETSSNYTRIRLKDSKLTGTPAIMQVGVKGDTNYITVTSEKNQLNTAGDNKNLTLQVKHKTVATNLAPTVNNSQTFQSSSTTDTIGPSNTIQFFAVNSASDIVLDDAGHIHSITGNYITLSHNKLTTISPTYSFGNNNTSGTISYSFSDSIGSTGLPSLDVNLRSDSLRIDTYSVNNTATALTIDLVWGNFT